MANGQNVTSQVENITPKKAAEMLSRNVVNRKMNRRHIMTLAGAMERGEWRLNGQSISFNANGDLQDGQHRLSAVIKSKKTVPMLVVRGVEQDARITVDTGRKRLVADELSMRGEKNVTSLSSTLLMVRRMDVIQGRTGGVDMTSTEALEMLEQDPLIREATEMAVALRHYAPAPSSVIGYCIYKFMQISKHDNEQFWEPFQTGVFTGPEDPRFVLQRALNQYAASRTFSAGLYRNKLLLVALIVKAWNLYRQGKTTKRLRFNTDESLPRPM